MPIREFFQRPSLSKRTRVFEWSCKTLQNGVQVLHAIQNARSLRPRSRIPRIENLESVWKYAKDPAFHAHFVSAVGPLHPHLISLNLIKDHPVFHSNSNIPQTDIPARNHSLPLRKLWEYSIRWGYRTDFWVLRRSCRIIYLAMFSSD